MVREGGDHRRAATADGRRSFESWQVRLQLGRVSSDFDQGVMMAAATARGTADAHAAYTTIPHPGTGRI